MPLESNKLFHSKPLPDRFPDLRDPLRTHSTDPAGTPGSLGAARRSKMRPKIGAAEMRCGPPPALSLPSSIREESTHAEDRLARREGEAASFVLVVQHAAGDGEHQHLPAGIHSAERLPLCEATVEDSKKDKQFLPPPEHRSIRQVARQTI